jgi:hypothetical protein
MHNIIPTKPGRIVEWQHTFIMLAIGLALIWPEPTMTGPLFVPLIEIMPEKAWAALMLVMGAVRSCALIVNGVAPTGSPIARMFVAWIGVMVWSLIAYTFWLASPIGLWAASVYVVLAIFELKIIWSAARDLKGGL